MGSEHSTQNMTRQASLGHQALSKPSVNIKRQYTIAYPGSTVTAENAEGIRPGSISPGPSVCSDTDLPYISYTVNRPIGGKRIKHMAELY